MSACNTPGGGNDDAAADAATDATRFETGTDAAPDASVDAPPTTDVPRIEASADATRDAADVHDVPDVSVQPDVVPETGVDAPSDDVFDAADVPIDVPPSGCTVDADCDDGVFCDGSEVCAPADPAADARGCVQAATTPCATDPARTCDEAARACVCITPDGDGDGAASIACGGGDCDDTNAAIYPSAVEACNGVDDDCNGQTDEDPAASAACGTPGNQSFACVAGQCVVAGCVAGAFDCDGNATNGCECAASAAQTAQCNGTACAYTCNTGYRVCGGVCKARTDPQACGSTCTVCPARTGEVATCDGYSCGTVCAIGYERIGGACTAMITRPMAPMSTSTVSTRRPTLRWELATSDQGARVEICRDRACATILATMDVTGTSVAPSADLPPGVVYWRLHGISGGVVSATVTPTWQFNVPARSSPRDTSFGSTLDVNGDGFADVAVGAPDDESNLGNTYVYMGSAAGIPTTPTLILGSLGEYSGAVVASAGDVNGDGYGDLITSNAAVHGANGNIQVYLGSAAGIPPMPSATLSLFGADFGQSLASLGDINGDGYGDIVAGPQPSYYSPTFFYIYYGGPTGFRLWDQSEDPMYMGMSQPYFMDGFGWAVAGPGDIDGDGFPDIVVSDWQNHVYVYSRRGRLLLTVPPDGGSGFGHTLSAAGDANGDGYPDLLVSGSGNVYEFFGGNLAGTPGEIPGAGNFYQLAGAGDINGDGYGDAIVHIVGVDQVVALLGSDTGLGATPAATLDSPVGLAHSYGTALAGGGDVNGDGFGDVVVGAPFDMSDYTYSGEAFVYDGNASGLVSTPATTLLDVPGGRWGTNSAEHFGGAVGL